MRSLRHKSLVARATLAILLLVALVGAASLWLGYGQAMRRESAQAQAQLRQLLDTVEHSARVACFLGDKKLAGELAEGLLANRIVQQVTILSDREPLVRSERPGHGLVPSSHAAPISVEPIQRSVYSPFDSSELVGEIRLVPDQAEIARQVRKASRFIGSALLVQILAVGMAVVAVVYGFITRPLTRIASQLRTLPAEEGAKLGHAGGHDRDEIGQLVDYVNHLIDRLVRLLNEERQLRQEREIEERKFRSIFEHAATGIFLLDHHGQLLSCNPACKEILLTALSDDPRQPGISSFFENDAQSTRAFIDLCRQENRAVQRDICLRGADGRPDRWFHLTLSQIDEVMYQGVVNDITDRKLAEESALEVAMTDGLTGLLNRRGFETRLRDRIQRGRLPSASRSALMLIDLDLFKEVNDTYGHDAGDLVLVKVAKRLNGLVRKTDIVGRLGGDEFIILLHLAADAGHVESVARKIVDALAMPIDLGQGRSVVIGASIGIAISPRGPFDQERLFKRADEAMYRAKKSGRNTYCFHETARFST